jgi:hypothetical protein
LKKGPRKIYIFCVWKAKQSLQPALLIIKETLAEGFSFAFEGIVALAGGICGEGLREIGRWKMTGEGEVWRQM